MDRIDVLSIEHDQLCFCRTSWFSHNNQKLQKSENTKYFKYLVGELGPSSWVTVTFENVRFVNILDFLSFRDTKNARKLTCFQKCQKKFMGKDLRLFRRIHRYRLVHNGSIQKCQRYKKNDRKFKGSKMSEKWCQYTKNLIL